MKQKKENRGGLRNPKGGRPEKSDAEKRTFHSIGFDKRIWQWLEETHGKDKHNFINSLLATYKTTEGAKATTMAELHDNTAYTLAKAIRLATPAFWDNPNGAFEYTCPFCLKTSGFGMNNIDRLADISHHDSCPYLMAKTITTFTPEFLKVYYIQEREFVPFTGIMVSSNNNECCHAVVIDHPDSRQIGKGKMMVTAETKFVEKQLDDLTQIQALLALNEISNAQAEIAQNAAQKAQKAKQQVIENWAAFKGLEYGCKIVISSKSDSRPKRKGFFVRATGFHDGELAVNYNPAKADGTPSKRVQSTWWNESVQKVDEFPDL